MANTYVNKVQLADGTSLIDISDTTATASDVLTGRYFYTASGQKVQGSNQGGSGDGYVWQDANGYVHLSDEEGTQITVDSLTITSGGTYTAPTGHAYSPVTVASGTAGTPTATKGSVSNHSISVTPSVTNTSGYITGSTKTGTAVSVSASELVSGTKSITQNGTGIDVTDYASVDVSVSGSATLTTKTITQNGTYNASSDNADGYSSVTVNVSGGGGSPYQLLGSSEVTTSTTSTTVTNISGFTLPLGSAAYTSNKLVYVKIRNKAGKVANYHYGNDCFVPNSYAYRSMTSDAIYMGCVCYYADYDSSIISYGPINYGITVARISSDGTLYLQQRYNSGYSKTINGTYIVEAYLLDFQDNPFL